MKEARNLLTFGLLAAWMAVGCGFAPLSRAGETADEQIAAGKALAERMCARCHSIGQTGASPFQEAPPFRTFKAKWGALDGLAEALAEGIVVGHEAMPEFVLEPKEIGALLSYMETLDGSRDP